MDAIINKQINKSVSSFPSRSIELVRISQINFTTGLPDCLVNAPSDDSEPVLNINSKKGINIPIEIIEKIMERIVHKK